MRQRRNHLVTGGEKTRVRKLDPVPIQSNIVLGRDSVIDLHAFDHVFTTDDPADLREADVGVAILNHDSDPAAMIDRFAGFDQTAATRDIQNISGFHPGVAGEIIPAHLAKKSVTRMFSFRDKNAVVPVVVEHLASPAVGPDKQASRQGILCRKRVLTHH